jgi:hypothetical protein
VTIRDGSDEEDDDGGVGGGEEFAPGGDADYFAEEDEDGRFLYVLLWSGARREGRRARKLMFVLRRTAVEDLIQCRSKCSTLWTMPRARNLAS